MHNLDTPRPVIAPRQGFARAIARLAGDRSGIAGLEYAVLASAVLMALAAGSASVSSAMTGSLDRVAQAGQASAVLVKSNPF
jgi:Flp pilus assembly pilin Flp